MKSRSISDWPSKKHLPPRPYLSRHFKLLQFKHLLKFQTWWEWEFNQLKSPILCSQSSSLYPKCYPRTMDSETLVTLRKLLSKKLKHQNKNRKKRTLSVILECSQLQLFSSIQHPPKMMMALATSETLKKHHLLSLKHPSLTQQRTHSAISVTLQRQSQWFKSPQKRITWPLSLVNKIKMMIPSPQLWLRSEMSLKMIK